MKNALFGPAGNSISFYEAGMKATVQAPGWVKKLGLGAYEYQAGKGIFGSDDTFTKIGEKAAEHDIKLSLHAPYYISLSSVEEEKRLKSVEYILSSARVCSLLGADVFVVHSGSTAKLDREEAMKYAEETLEAAAVALDASGYTAKAGLETMGKLNQLGTLDVGLRLCKVSLRHYRPVVDFGHLNARTQGGLASEDDFKRVFDTVARELSPEHAEELHCHFSKIEYTAKGEKKHLTFDDTVYGPSYEHFISAITSLGVHPTVICESDGTMAEDALAMQKLYEEKQKTLC